MTKQAVHKDVAGFSEVLKSKSGDTLAYRQLFDLISKTIPFADGFVVASVPRAGLQIVQPSRVPEVLVKAYAREFHQEDRATWLCTQRNKALRGTEAWGAGYDQSRYLRDFMLYNCNFYHMVAVPLKAPVFAGYPGAIHLYRYREQGAFTDAEIAKLTDVARLVDDATEQLRQARKPQQFIYQVPWAHRLGQRQFVFDQRCRCIYGQEVFAALDEKLQQQILHHCGRRLDHVGGSAEIEADRLQLPDVHNDLWTFRVMPYRSYSALSDGPVVFYCLQPEASDWASIRPNDFAADTELVRLVPAVRFMQQEYHRSPALGEIARVVHLSPFHFHRRFTELLGLTPKHFLLECQIFEAKRQLMARQKELSQIASDCGFAHQSHFTSRFKQATDLTPTRWRRVAQDLQRASA